MNLYELTGELRDAMERLQIDEETGEITSFEAVDALDVAFEDKAEAYALTIKNLLAFAEAAKAESKAVAERAKAAENRANRLKTHLAQSMAAVSKDKIVTPRAALSFRASTSVDVEDENLVPDDYFRVEMLRKLDKATILKKLKEGGCIPGCRLMKNRNLQIK